MLIVNILNEIWCGDKDNLFRYQTRQILLRTIYSDNNDVRHYSEFVFYL